MSSNMGNTLKLHFRTSTEAIDDNISSLKNDKVKTISNILCGAHVFSRKQICLLILFSYFSVCFLSMVTTVSTVYILRYKCTGKFGLIRLHVFLYYKALIEMFMRDVFMK